MSQKASEVTIDRWVNSPSVHSFWPLTVTNLRGYWYTGPGPRFNIKMSSYQHRKSHCGDKTVVRSSYLHNGISYTGKMSSLYWIRAQEIHGIKTVSKQVQLLWYTLVRSERWHTFYAVGFCTWATLEWEYMYRYVVIVNKWYVMP